MQRYLVQQVKGNNSLHVYNTHISNAHHTFFIAVTKTNFRSIATYSCTDHITQISKTVQSVIQ
jgi:hypothetical protein